MLLITVLWGACFVAIRWGLRDAPVFWYAALRALVAGVALLAVARWRGQRSPAGARSWLLVTALGLVNVTLAFGAMFAATQGTATGVAAVLSNAQPLLILLPAWALYAERPDAPTVILMLVGLGGLALVAGGGGSGALIALLATVGITAGTLLVRQLAGVSIVAASAWHFVLGGLVLAVIALAVEGPPQIAWTPRFVGLLLFLALAGTAVASVLWFEETLRAPLAALSVWVLLVPAFGVLFGAVFLGERLGARQLAGVGLVVGAISAVQARQHGAGPLRAVVLRLRHSRSLRRGRWSTRSPRPGRRQRLGLRPPVGRGRPIRRGR
jgi:drug/metabolite transporter (DMT)-like permease